MVKMYQDPGEQNIGKVIVEDQPPPSVIGLIEKQDVSVCVCVCVCVCVSVCVWYFKLLPFTSSSAGVFIFTAS